MFLFDDPWAIHPADFGRAVEEICLSDGVTLDRYAIGNDCARKLGLDFTVPL